MKTIALNFKGYWREVNKEFVPSESGIYTVYACTYNQQGKVSIRELLYIGESENVCERLQDHERLSDWKWFLRPNETLCYSVAKIGAADRVRAEAALIHHHKPPCNTEYVHSFPYEHTRIITKGMNALLSSDFTEPYLW